MTHELTKDGLFNYFGADTVRQIIEFPLVKRHISVIDYCQCRDILADPSRLDAHKQQKSTDSIHAILSFNALKHASVDEITQYLSVEKIKATYSNCYGKYFELFMSKFKAFQANPPQAPSPGLCLDPIREKKLIMLIKASMALPLQAFSHALSEQDAYLQQIEAQLVIEAGKAQEFIAAIQEADMRYKETVVSLAFSMVRMGLSVAHAGDLVSISQSIASLATSGIDKIENKLSAVILDVQLLVMNTHSSVLEAVERELLDRTSIDQIKYRWTMYRTELKLRSTEAIDHVLNGCVTSDNFVRCVLKETMSQYEGLNEDELLLNASENACRYVTKIYSGLKAQVNKIHHIKDVVLSPQGNQSIETYFRRICLINYTLQHENSPTMTQRWLTKKLGHRLSYYFPDVVFQKKWSSETWLNFIHHHIDYGKKQLTLDEYRNLRKNASVVLGLFRISSQVRQQLFANLEEEIPQIHNRLMDDLHQSKREPEPLLDDVFLDDGFDSTRVTRFVVHKKKRRSTLFSFDDPNSASNPDQGCVKQVQKAEPAVVLLSRRDLEPFI